MSTERKEEGKPKKKKRKKEMVGVGGPLLFLTPPFLGILERGKPYARTYAHVCNDLDEPCDKQRRFLSMAPLKEFFRLCLSDFGY
jgi:hypothetical protein